MSIVESAEPRIQENVLWGVDYIFRATPDEIKRGVIPLDPERYDAVEMMLNKDYGHHYIGDGPRGKKMYLLGMGGCVKVGTVVGRKRISILHESSEGAMGLIELLGLPRPAQIGPSRLSDR